MTFYLMKSHNFFSVGACIQSQYEFWNGKKHKPNKKWDMIPNSKSADFVQIMNDNWN